MDIRNVTIQLFKQHCKLCGDVKTYESFKIIDDVTREILRLLLLKLAFNNATQYVMCKTCSSKLLAALNFKYTCVYTDSVIIPFVDFENPTTIDLKDVYAQQKASNETYGTFVDQEICRLCLEPISGDLWPVEGVDVDSIQMFIPEINFDVSANPTICSQCQDSLCVHSAFLKHCSDSQKIINRNEPYKTGYNFPEDPHDVTDLEIKSEDSEDNWNQGEITAQSPDEKYRRTKYKYKTRSERQCVRHELARVDGEENSEKRRCTFNKRNVDLNWTLDSYTKMHECRTCGYRTKKISHLKRHRLIHMDLSKVRMYSCQKCDYKTKRGDHLRRHELLHVAYKCASCAFETSRKSLLVIHLQRHRARPKKEVYRCDKCDYKTRNRHRLTSHQLVHVEPPQAPVDQEAST